MTAPEAMATVTLYTRAGCHLCEEAERVLRAEQARSGFRLDAVDVDADPELARRYGGFEERGFRIAALVDVDPDTVGQELGSLLVEHIDDLDRIVKEHQIAIGVIATPAAAAQEVCDRLVAAGVTSILNFAPALLQVPPHVSLRKVDLSTELQILSFHEQRRAAQDLVRRGRQLRTRSGGVPGLDA